ncbi:protein NIM1-INTERACTING 3 [Elaeis guineensis]|uniref:Protein NIM1-INTERACTING 3 n=1 Tax=Elaeis guineensis var. tenera TaxID=51953 RepID=A0A6I9QDG0_ELAGV|nr:protein NIM1-INTERACTING 3 [Elaeis guineensis]
MEGSRRGKRPACVDSPSSSPPPPQQAPLTEADEEEKIEKFYALIGNIRAMRDLWRTSPTNKRQRKEEPLWRPTFAPEDFIDPDETAGRPEGGLVACKEGKRRKGGEKEARGGEESSLDLNLALY